MSTLRPRILLMTMTVFSLDYRAMKPHKSIDTLSYYPPCSPGDAMLGSLGS